MQREVPRPGINPMPQQTQATAVTTLDPKPAEPPGNSWIYFLKRLKKIKRKYFSVTQESYAKFNTKFKYVTADYTHLFTCDTWLLLHCKSRAEQ